MESGVESYFDIILLAMIAAFLIFRLRSVLGRKTGEEQHRYNAFAQRPERKGSAPSGDAERSGAAGDNVVHLPDQGDRQHRDRARVRSGLQAGLAQIHNADSSFDPGGFLNGAKSAFGIIVEAFAQGDTATLRPLLSDELYDEFSDAIRQRLNLRQTLETRIEAMREAEITAARLDGRTAYVTVKFATRQMMALRDGTGDVIDGAPDETLDVTDLWTFARNTRASDPSWTLVSTEVAR